jgi:hypothetical protein
MRSVTGTRKINAFEVDVCILTHILYLKLLNGFNPLTPELNPSAQRCLTGFLTGDFAS